MKLNALGYLILPILLTIISCDSSNYQKSTASNEVVTENMLSPLEVHTTYPKGAYIEDLNQLFDSIVANHPNPYEFLPKESFESLVAEKKASITASTTIGEFVWLCNSVMAAVGCGHSAVSIENVLQLDPSLFFPMEAKFIGSKLYAIDPLSNETAIEVGKEIRTINGIEVSQLQSLLRKNIPADGYNESMRDYYINKHFSSYVAFQLGFPKKYSVQITDETGFKKVDLTPIDQHSPSKKSSTSCGDNLCFEVDTANNLGIITIQSFVYYNEMLPQFQAFIDDCFQKISEQGLEHLAIDLRGNGGGDPYCGAYLLQHISDIAFRYYKQDDRPYYTDLKDILPLNDNRFKGKPYILVNGGCFSTTGHVSALIRSLDAGIFVGQETGATFSCNANSFSFELNNTGIATYIATEVYQTDVQGFAKDQGILPDYPTSPNLSDLLEDSDLEMEKVLKLIGGE